MKPNFENKKKNLKNRYIEQERIKKNISRIESPFLWMEIRNSFFSKKKESLPIEKSNGWKMIQMNEQQASIGQQMCQMMVCVCVYTKKKKT